MHRGYIKLWRKFRDSEIIYNEGLCQLAIYLLLKVRHEHGKVFGIDCLPGQTIIGRESLSNTLRVKPSTIYKRLKKLQKIGFLEQQSNNRRTIVTICNWETYNGTATTKEQQSNNKVTTKEQQSNTKKNEKNIDNVKNENIYQYGKTVEDIYLLYPTKCPVRGISNSKTPDKNKKKIMSILETKYPLEKAINWYVKNCQENNVYMKNFSTFLNNLPDIGDFEKEDNLCADESFFMEGMKNAYNV